MIPDGLCKLFRNKPEKKGSTINAGDLDLVAHEEKSPETLDANLEKQMHLWRENPNWTDHPPVIKVTVPEGSLCNLSMKFKAGLPPDAIFNIITDPDNRRVFKNIKEVVSRKVLVDEGLRQVVEVEQAAIWKFLWWSGTLAVHVYVDQNRANHTVEFKQGKSGFMKRFEGNWSLAPLFVDEELCSHKPATLAEYKSCTDGKGRVGTLVHLEQLVQPAVVIPPPISWYVRGITTRTIEMMISDLQAETARLRGSMVVNDDALNHKSGGEESRQEYQMYTGDIVKRRWHDRRNRRR